MQNVQNRRVVFEVNTSTSTYKASLFRDKESSLTADTQFSFP